MMNIYLVGYMCCGKTTIGKKLAKRLGYNFIDLDQLFEKENNTSISNC
ncbi:MAG: shikimate kinase, partial [Bacteroidales bacterium]|nr:shikimate kinase [Bacteroidales bacterium]